MLDVFAGAAVCPQWGTAGARRGIFHGGVAGGALIGEGRAGQGGVPSDRTRLRSGALPVVLGVPGADHLGAGRHLGRFGIPSGFAKQDGVVLQALGHEWMLQPQRLSHDR